MSIIHTKHTYRVDLNRCPLEAALQRPLSHTDALADTLVIAVRRGMTPVALAGMSVQAYLTNSNRQTLPIAGDVSGSSVIISLPAEAYATPGPFQLAVQLHDGDTRHTLMRLSGEMARISTETLIPGDALPTLPELLAEIGAMRTATAEASDTAAAAAAATADLTGQVAGAIADMSGALNQAAPAILNGTTASLVSLTDAAARPAKWLLTNIPTTTAGVEAVTLTRTGRNLIAQADYVMTQGHTATTVTDDCIDVTKPTAYDYGKIPVHLKAGVTYTLVIDWEVYGRAEGDSSPSTAGYRVVGLESTANQATVYANGTRRLVKTYTPDATMDTDVTWYPNFGNISSNGGRITACSRARIMLIEGAYTLETAPIFEICVRETRTAALPEAVHGGTLDWTSGALLITHGADGAALDAPVTHQLTTQQLTLLEGRNHVWSSCGDTAVAYVADTKLYIDNQLAAIAASIINA